MDTTSAFMEQFELRDMYLSSWETAWAHGHLPELFNKSLSSWKMEIHMNILGKTLSFWTSNCWALGPELDHLVTQSWTTTWAPGHIPDRPRKRMSSWETAWAICQASSMLNLFEQNEVFRKEVITHQGPGDGCIFLDKRGSNSAAAPSFTYSSLGVRTQK